MSPSDQSVAFVSFNMSSPSNLTLSFLNRAAAAKMAKDTVAHLEELEEDSSVQVIGILACAGILLASVAARCIMFIRRGGWRSPQLQVLLPQDVVDRAPVVSFQTGAVDAYTRRSRHSTSLSPSGFRTPGDTPMSPIQSTGNSQKKIRRFVGEILVLFLFLRRLY